MTKISRSPERFTFQKKGYIERMEKGNEPVNKDYLDYFQKMIEDHNTKFDNTPSRENNMEYDLLTTDWILEKVRASKTYAQNLYAAMCNVDWRKRDLWQELAESNWGCSWRYAGGIIADMRQEGDYIDWYCSGMGGGLGNGDENGVLGYVSEGTVTEEIEKDLNNLGWRPVY